MLWVRVESYFYSFSSLPRAAGSSTGATDQSPATNRRRRSTSDDEITNHPPKRHRTDARLDSTSAASPRPLQPVAQVSPSPRVLAAVTPVAQTFDRNLLPPWKQPMVTKITVDDAMEALWRFANE